MRFLYLIVPFLVLVLLLACGCAKQQAPPSNDDSHDNIETPPAELVADQHGPFALEEVKTHDSEDDCWLLIDGKVYDVTEFIASHPGGKAIVEGCGTDATGLYETRPMGSGTPHSDKARGMLSDYYIGEVI